MCVCVCCVCAMLSHVQLFATPWIVAHQALLSMEFSRQEYWSGLPFPPPGDLLDPGTEPTSHKSPTLAGGFFTSWATGEALSSLYLCQIHRATFDLELNCSGMNNKYSEEENQGGRRTMSRGSVNKIKGKTSKTSSQSTSDRLYSCEIDFFMLQVAGSHFLMSRAGRHAHPEDATCREGAIQGSVHPHLFCQVTDELPYSCCVIQWCS